MVDGYTVLAEKCGTVKGLKITLKSQNEGIFSVVSSVYTPESLRAR